MFDSVKKSVLPNGLTVLTAVDAKAPVACIFTWVKAGYFDETDAEVGIAHFIEHLYFKGTRTRAVGEIARQTKALGGYLNASTIYDYTSYYAMVPAPYVSEAIAIQADALMNPLFDAEEMEREKKVIVQEMKRKLDTPHAYAREKLLELSYEAHRMRRWRIGHPENIQSYTRDEVLDFYHRHYRSENIIVCAVGDIDQEKVHAELSQLYDQVLSGAQEKNWGPSEAPQTQARMYRLLGDVSQSYLKMGFHGPAIDSPDYAPMLALSILMGKGRSSRFYRRIKEQEEKVFGVGTSQFGFGNIGYFLIEAELDASHLSRMYEQIWEQIILMLSDDPPSTEEMEKVRTIMEANFFKEKEEVMSYAYALAYFESLGGYEKAMEFIQRVRNVQIADVIRVARTYLRFDKMNALEYVPHAVGQGAETPARLESLEKRVDFSGAQRDLDVHPSVEAQPLKKMPAESKRNTEIETLELASGLKISCLRNTHLPLVSLGCRFYGGRLDETTSNAGITNFLLRCTTKGTEHKTAEEIAFDLERWGISLDAGAAADHFGYQLTCLKEKLDPAMDLLTDLMFHPRLSRATLNTEKENTLALISQSEDHMMKYPIELFYRALFGMHPYGLSRNGTRESIGALQSADIHAWHEDIFSVKDMHIALVGDFQTDETLKKIERAFAFGLQADAEKRAKIYPVVPRRDPIENEVQRNRQQTALAMGFNGVTAASKDYFTLEVIRNILAGMGGRLFTELREKRSLAYTVTAFNISLLRGGAFFMYAACDPEKESEVKNRLLSEIEKLTYVPVDSSELEATKKFTAGIHALSLQKNMSIAYMLNHQFMMGLRGETVFNYEQEISQVSAQDVLRVARHIFDGERCALGIVRGK